MKEQLAKEGGELAHDICQKTIRRLISWCEKEGKLNTFNLKLEHKTKNVTVSCWQLLSGCVLYGSGDSSVVECMHTRTCTHAHMH